MGLVAPMMNGIGGDLFAIVYDAKTGKLYGLNASGWAPRRLTIEFSKARARAACRSRHPSRDRAGRGGGLGCALRRFGTQDSPNAGPGDRLRRGGFPVTEMSANGAAPPTISAAMPRRRESICPTAARPRSARSSAIPIWRRSLARIAKNGRDAFYKGAIAQAHSRDLGAARRHVAADDWPSSSRMGGPDLDRLSRLDGLRAAAERARHGGAEMLKSWRRFRSAQWGHNRVEALHAKIEAKKLAYADMLRYIADPRFANVPVTALISQGLRRERAKLIEPSEGELRVGAGHAA